MSRARPVRVFVHLAHGFGAAQWQAKWERDEIIGLNDRLPYGYFWAEEDGCAIEYSEDRSENRLQRWFRLGLRQALGFDFIHAWRNRRGILAAEIVWTHTESQHLAVLLLLRLAAGPHRPKVIAQSVWLFDTWPRLSLLKRWVYRRLIADAAALTVLSPENLRQARDLFPGQRSHMIPFGVCGDVMVDRPHRGAAHRPFRVLSLGHDRHRDWQTLIAAVRDCPDIELRIVAPRLPAGLHCGGNITLLHPATNAQLAALYAWADLVALALSTNLHASGITVIQEATVFGAPVVCSDTGGLRAYFGDGEVRYVPPGDPDALRAAIAALAASAGDRRAMVEHARRRMIAAGLTSRDFGRRHAALSRDLLSQKGPPIPPARKQRRRSARYRILAGLALAAFVLLAPATAVAADAPDGAGATIDLCRFRRTFTEDFRTLSVSPHGDNGSRWIAHTPWNGDFGDAAFADPRPGFPFRIDHGMLDIEARKGANGKWQSGLLASATPTTAGFAQRYGYFEMRARLPPGPGTWPAFWLDANQPRGDQAPGVEVDVMEYYGQFPGAYHSTIHVWNKRDPKLNRVEEHIVQVPAGSLTDAFHTYGADVEPDRIRFYLDRREVWSATTPPELRDPLMVLVDLALGSGWPIDQTPNPSIMKVAYIHVYAPGSGAEAAGGNCADR